MTNKRKKLARSLSEKTGMPYQAVINRLRLGQPAGYPPQLIAPPGHRASAEGEKFVGRSHTSTLHQTTRDDLFAMLRRGRDIALGWKEGRDFLRTTQELRGWLYEGVRRLAGDSLDPEDRITIQTALGVFPDFFQAGWLPDDRLLTLDRLIDTLEEIGRRYTFKPTAVSRDEFAAFLRAAKHEDAQLGLGAALHVENVARRADFDFDLARRCLAHALDEALAYRHRADDEEHFFLNHDDLNFAFAKMQPLKEADDDPSDKINGMPNMKSFDGVEPVWVISRADGGGWIDTDSASPHLYIKRVARLSADEEEVLFLGDSDKYGYVDVTLPTGRKFFFYRTPRGDLRDLLPKKDGAASFLLKTDRSLWRVDAIDFPDGEPARGRLQRHRERSDEAKQESNPGADDMDRDARFMKMAIDEARRCVREKLGAPKVGAVVVKDGILLAKAYRGELVAGEHAEFTVLEKKLPKEKLIGATLYTTLEPCTTRNHPKVSCAHRIVERGISRVVIGILDPNPDIGSRGCRTLEEASIDVGLGIKEHRSEIRELNRDFIREHPIGAGSTQAEITARALKTVMDMLEGDEARRARSRIFDSRLVTLDDENALQEMGPLEASARIEGDALSRLDAVAAQLDAVALLMRALPAVAQREILRVYALAIARCWMILGQYLGIMRGSRGAAYCQGLEWLARECVDELERRGETEVRFHEPALLEPSYSAPLTHLRNYFGRLAPVRPSEIRF
jgi:pyrimidine deaminase RibD-like protein